MNNERVASGTFALGQVVMTRRAMSAFVATREQPFPFLSRHQLGDWDDVSPEDAAENAFSVAHGFRLLSVYRLNDGMRIWILTEADRSVTTILLPDEY